ncbi:MAG: hypothetical protein HOV80_38375 [Polyangiaceae bacterium]|nr:hypothetical protein [Polyangiaceae bacterium]
MSNEPKPAARLNDYVAHDNSQFLKFLGFVFSSGVTMGAMAAAKSLVKAPLLLAGPLGWGAFAVITIADWYVSKWFQSYIDEESKKSADPGVPKIAQGCEQVFVNSLQAARANFDHVICQIHGFKLIKQGSEWVTINKQPASRWQDRTECPGAFLTENPGNPPKNVYYGGPATEYANQAAYHQLAELLLTLYGGKGGFYEAGETLVGEGSKKALDAAWDVIFK